MYEARPGATEFTRLYEAPQQVIVRFKQGRSDEEWEDQFDWIPTCTLTCDTDEAFPETLTPQQGHLMDQYPQLQKYQFRVCT